MSVQTGSNAGYRHLQGKPCEKVPNPESLYFSESLAGALNVLTYAVHEHQTPALLMGSQQQVEVIESELIESIWV